MEYTYQDMEVVLKELISKDFNIAIGNTHKGWSIYIAWTHDHDIEYLDYEHKDLPYAVCTAYRKAYERRYGV